jgi:farnesyl diphosphate synthase
MLNTDSAVTSSNNSMHRYPFPDWMLSHQARIEEVLDTILPSVNIAPARLHEAMRYSAMNGGKRIRALLCYATAELCDMPIALTDTAACAVELIHAYSLVHDDMPCMDDDDLRRGKPSCHKQYDDATALLVGDALQTLAFNMLSAKNLTVFDRHYDSNTDVQAMTTHQCQSAQLRMVNILARASGSLGMAGGQAIDLAATGKPLSQTALETMHRLKTGALIEASVAMCTAHLEDNVKNNALKADLSQFSRSIGLAFQVVDDILDVEADTATLGKTAGKDLAANKPTFVSILGLDAAKLYAASTYNNAINALADYTDKAERLKSLAQLITRRST